MGEKWDKFILLMWKNWVLQYRRPIQTLIEVLAPVAFSILLVVLRSLVEPKDLEAVNYEPICTTPTDSCADISQLFDWGDYYSNFTLLYAPENEETKEIMQPFNLIFNSVKGFQDDSTMLSYYDLYTKETVFAGIDFGDGSITAGNVKLTIRFPGELRKEATVLVQTNWLTNLIYPVLQTAGPRDYINATGATPGYRNEGFLGIQHLVSLFISMYNANITIPDTADLSEWIEVFQGQKIPLIQMERFPNAAWTDDILLTPLQSFVGLIFMLSFVYTCINTVKAITTEKEKQLKEAMKIMGLPNWLHWTAWFLKSFTFLFISIVLMVVLLKVSWYKNTDYTVFTHANAFVLLIFLFFYGCAIITFCFAISVFFSKANTAATMAGFAYFVCYAPYSFMQNNYDSLNLATKLVASLAANTGMAFGFQIVLMYEGTGEGVQFNNIWTPNTPDDDLSLGLVMVMLAIDSVVYLLIALYVEAVFPGDYGVPQKWYFPFTSSFWCGHSVDGNEKYPQVQQNDDFFEAEPENLKAGIKVQNLRKVFDKKVAVNSLSLNMFENQITVLLGHNGAGKSTTMSMLTGMFTPTSGLALINGFDIRTEMDSVRNSLGLCPQHNIIFDDLTVAEHLYFFSKLKGLRGKEIDEEINKYIDLLELQPKRNSKSSKLSGGMKRKLCVGVALCGDSKVVMLDEPTAGMDPSARRALWELMLKQKTGRTILLTTHFMDEADLLGDRIAIMAGGEIKCCGSSFFLKKKYGAGYHLVLDKSPRCDPAKVTALLQRYIPNIEIESLAGSELTYLMSENQSYVFESMLKDLEDQSEDLGINSYGVSLTTLEEVFMKVGADHSQEEIANGLKYATNGTDSATSLNLPRVTGMEFLLNQLWAMTFKRVLSTLRSWVIFVLHILLPVIFLIVSIFVNRQLYSVGDLPSMHLSLSTFTSSVSLVQGANTSSDYSSILSNLLADSYKETDSISAVALNLTAETPSVFRRRYITGVLLEELSTDSDIFDVSFTSYFNNDPYHTPAIALGVAANTMYRKLTQCDDCSIDVTNYPFPYDTQTSVNNVAMGNSTGFQIAFNLSFGMAFVSAFYVLFIIRERASKSKHLQFVSGVKVLIFWTINFLWDFLTYVVIVAALIIALLCFQEDGFKTREDIGVLSLIFVYFGWSMLPMMYLLAFWYEIPSSGYTKLIFINIATGCVAFLIVQILVTPGLDLEYVGDALHWVLLAVPHYSLSTGVRDSNQVYVYNTLCDNFFDTCRSLVPNATDEQCLQSTPSMRTYCEDLDRSYFKWESPGIGRNLLYSFVSGFVFFALLLLVEFEVFAKINYLVQQRFFPKSNVEVPNEDSDVQEEKHKIRTSSNANLVQNYNIIVKDLTKYYKNHLAVNGLCLGIKEAECFGLLGINGAGKTTTFKMLTGDERISYGDAWVRGNSIKTRLKEVQKSIGYCPQFDALLDDLTARESLHMFALLRGIPRSYCNTEANRLASDFDYVQHLDKKVKELSGGNKRKLSTSIALIGDPSVVYLDEPTTGMDPATKRYLFNALCKERDRGKSIILTSHSMEECEALCTRLAVMVNGNFKCLGSTQHLKSKFAEGYTLTIKVRKPKNSAASVHASTEPIKNFVKLSFPNSIIREEYEEMLTYYVTDKNIPWSAMFGILERGKNNPELNIEDYSLCQSSLEQVFLTFTRHQHEV